MKNTVLSVLFTPKEGVILEEVKWRYTLEWAEKLMRQTQLHSDADFALLTNLVDPHIDGMIHFPLINPDLSWKDTNQIWRPDVTEGRRILWMGLDNMIVGSLDPIFALEGEMVIAREVGWPQQMHVPNYGAVLYDSRIATELHEYDRANPKLWDQCRKFHHGNYSDLEWMQRALMQEQMRSRWSFFDEKLPGSVLSFNFDLDRNPDWIPDDARVIYMHGRPKQHHLPEDSKLRKLWV